MPKSLTSKPRTSPTHVRQRTAFSSSSGYERMISMPSGVCPVILCLDISGSMQDTSDSVRGSEHLAPIDFLVEGLRQLHHELANEQGGCPWVDLCILTFQGRHDKKAMRDVPVIDCLKPFGPLSDWHPPAQGELIPNGTTCIGAALLNAQRRLIEWTKACVNVKGPGAYKKPRLFLMTDGRTSPYDGKAFSEARSWLHHSISMGKIELTTIFCCPPDLQDSPVAQEAKRELRSLFPATCDYNCQPYVYGVDRLAFRDFLLEVSSSTIECRAFSPTPGQRG